MDVAHLDISGSCRPSNGQQKAPNRCQPPERLPHNRIIPAMRLQHVSNNLVLILAPTFQQYLINLRHRVQEWIGDGQLDRIALGNDLQELVQKTCGTVVLYVPSAPLPGEGAPCEYTVHHSVSWRWLVTNA